MRGFLGTLTVSRDKTGTDTVILVPDDFQTAKRRCQISPDDIDLRRPTFDDIDLHVISKTYILHSTSLCRVLCTTTEQFCVATTEPWEGMSTVRVLWPGRQIVHDLVSITVYSILTR